MKLVIIILLYYLAIKLQTNLFVRWQRNGHSGRMVIYLVVTLFTFWFGLSGFIALVCASTKMNKEREKVYNALSQNPNDANVDALIEELQGVGCENHPNAWNRLRALWMITNESPNVTTEKKKQLKQFLMLKGLSIYHQDAQIIDNYKE